MNWLQKLLDLLHGGAKRRLREAVRRLEKASPADRPRAFASALRLAVRVDPVVARQLCQNGVRELSATELRPVLKPAWIDSLAEHSSDANLLRISFTLARHLSLTAPLGRAGVDLALLLAPERAADELISHLDQCRVLGLLDRPLLETILQTHLAVAPLSDNSAWKLFLAALPEPVLPRRFEVFGLLDRGTDAVALAASPQQKKEALACCLRCKDEESLRAGQTLAAALGEQEMLRQLTHQVGEVRFEAGDWETALTHFERAGSALRVSECRERLGQPVDALLCCPLNQQKRLLALLDPALNEILRTSNQQDYPNALKSLGEVVQHLQKVEPPGAEVAARMRGLQQHRTALLETARRFFVQQCEKVDGEARTQWLRRWSEAEEHSGDRVRAAQLAEEAGDPFRASLLWESDAQYGEALRVLGRHGARHEVIALMAELSERGGDLTRAARLYEECGRLADAVRTFAREELFSDAARCLLRQLGEEAAAESEEYERLLTQAGRGEELVRLWLRRLEANPQARVIVAHLRRALRSESPLPMSAVLRQDAERILAERLQSIDRRRFDAEIAGWISAARKDVLQRHAPAWGMDLGTSKCAVALYDIKQKQPVLCPFRGLPQMPSVLAVEVSGREVVGVREEELLGEQYRGAILRSKRQMGRRMTYRIGDREYRPEEVAARLIARGREVVEEFLRQEIREGVKERALAALGEVPPEWLEEATSSAAIPVSMPKAVITVPAYFDYVQKHATNEACAIAGIEVMRLIHEPTAACLTAASGRKLEGRFAVVDLGAGTLDLSSVEVADGVHSVQDVFGNNEFGSSDFDEIIRRHLIETLKQRGIEIGSRTLEERRLRVAAEDLKIQLSSRATARCALPAFGSAGTVELELTRERFAGLIREELTLLEKLCHKAAKWKADHLLLVGAPMLSPLIRERIEKAIGLKAATLTDPRTAVACGAAIQAAVLTRSAEVLLIDIVPFSLGVRVVDKESRKSRFNIHIKKGTHIPASHKEVYSTLEDNQSGVTIEVFQGESSDPDENSKLAQFDLAGLPRAKAGVPQIEVTFTIDASSVLTVEAIDKGARKKQIIQVRDTTMLSPSEREAMRSRFESERQREREHLEWAALVGRIGDILESVTADDLRRVFGQWRKRFDAFRAAPTGYTTTSADEKVLVEMFNQAAELENLVTLAGDRFANVSRRWQEVRAESAGGAVGIQRAHELLLQGQQTSEELTQLLRRFREWDEVLAGLSLRISDPLQRFIASHEAGAHETAIAAFETLTAPAAPLLERYLDCLAARRDRTTYRRALVRHATTLKLSPIDFTRLDAFAQTWTPSLVRLMSADEAEWRTLGVAFCVGPALVATSRRLLTGRSFVAVVGEQGYPVEEVLPTGEEVALLRLERPVTVPSFRVGHAVLLELGERAIALALPGQHGQRCAAGIVNRLGRSGVVRRVEVSLDAGEAFLGGPLLNDWGEAVGVIVETGKSRSVEVVGVEVLRDQLPRAW